MCTCNSGYVINTSIHKTQSFDNILLTFNFMEHQLINLLVIHVHHNNYH